MKAQIPDLTDDDFDLTPMIDIVFLLIIFFMVVAAEITTKVEVEIPTADKAKVPEDTGRRMEISVQEDGSTYVGMMEVTLEELGERVSRDASTIPGVKIYLRADVNTPHENVQDVMKTCAANGVINIIFATFK